ncbi:hypothetical protein MKX01_009540 [Papaver californicum]|nr:hypothetical protein MKX01_011800 [Papaver californicum]KAI3992379.1 hypothetical protein MKX01_009540 [Papaver californicum]
MFLHFGVNTFTNSEWGTGKEDPSIFNPTGLNANQCMDVAANSGVSLVILTAKHHDGFCLWPSQYTDHSVISSPWRDGKGDVVQEFVSAAKIRGIDIGLYGKVQEIWFDGAKGANAPNMSYYFQDCIFSDAGPYVRWVGDEKGYAGSTCWSTINQTALKIGEGSTVSYLNTGDPKGTDWLPAECDVSIRAGWFWHKSEKPKPLSELLNIYYNSVGSNCVLLLNVPPNTTGLVSETDIQRLGEFRKAIDTIFSVNLVEGNVIKASSQKGESFRPENVLNGDHIWSYWTPEDNPKDKHWIEILGDNKGGMKFNVLRIQEAIGLGQRIKKYEIYVDGKQVVEGTTIGYKRLHRLEGGVVHAKRVKILIKESRGLPVLSFIGLHFDPFWQPSKAISSNKTTA